MMRIVDVRTEYPGIAKAALEIAYDNGGINRSRTEHDCMKELAVYINENWLARHSGIVTGVIDDWLRSLPASDLSTVCAGEETEVNAILAKGPPDARHLLNEIFEYVC